MAAQYDLVVFGATSFVGQILSHYLAQQFGLNGELTWAIAGRSERKLQALRGSLLQELGDDAKHLPIIVADASDETALQQLCNNTRVVVSTVGPYALYGETLVKTCAATGTDYCDLTGEPQWIRAMIDRYQDQAVASGARIVHCCGFDSIPSDMGVYHLQQQAQQQFGQSAKRVKMRVKAAKGGMSGGTVASIVNLTKEAVADPGLRKQLANPFALCPAGHGFSARQPNQKGAQFDRDFNAWSTPFIMAAINTRIVHRSNALRENAYGADFVYDEAMLTGRGGKGRIMAGAIVAGLAAFMAGAAIKPSRWLLEKTVLPKPGEGPSPEDQLNGFFDIRFQGTDANGNTITTKVTGDRDPGYGSTGKMLGQAAAALALDYHKDKEKVGKDGGFWTPASIFDERFIERLTEHAGLTFEVLD
ncbi:saccharopine dehydrogenase [Bacterioplanes sanyensis]|uniref:Saccharopine dehydrogenase n=1 Tax=Bacterioplanes sanyensis TaxID=1249553 RepID=A0A222FLV0_9GAMM|nr:saccharopine dehydrogenase [Bacterioplanes sanyensis]